MLNFFRKIRQKLLSENKLGKYLFYAFGEIILVVIGILIALQINNWNEAEKTKKLELEYLTNLKEEYQNNADALQKVIQIRAKVVENIDKLITNSDSESSEIESKEWQNLVFSIDSYGEYVFEAKSPILDEIKNSGNMVNVSNSELRVLLTLWEQQMSGIFGTQQEIKKYRDKITDILSEFGVLNTELTRQYDGYIDYTPSRKKVEHLSMWKNNLILLRDVFLYLQNDIYPNVNSYLEEVITLIEKEIK